jgi:hypothetical protein
LFNSRRSRKLFERHRLYGDLHNTRGNAAAQQEKPCSSQGSLYRRIELAIELRSAPTNQIVKQTEETNHEEVCAEEKGEDN